MDSNNGGTTSETTLLIKEDAKGSVNGSRSSDSKNVIFLQQFLSKHSGIFHGLLAGILNPAVEVFADQLTSYCGPGQVLFYRYLFSCPLNIILILLTEKQWLPDTSEFLYVSLRGILGGIACLCMYTAFTYIPYIDAMVIYFGCLMLSTSVVSRIFLSEYTSVFRIFTMVVILIGVIVTSQPTFLFRMSGADGKDALLGTLWSVSSGLVFGIGICISRRIVKTPATTTAFYTSIFGIITGLTEILLFQNFEFKNGILVVELGSIMGFLNTAVMYIYARAVQISRATDLTSALTIEVPTGLLLQYFVLNIPPNIMAIIGGILVASSILMLTMEDAIYLFFRKKSVPYITIS